jgi:hypothetical protein
MWFDLPDSPQLDRMRIADERVAIDVPVLLEKLAG